MKLFSRVLIFIISIFVLSCSSQKNPSLKLDQMNQIKYRFKDSSTPPRFHRSYTIHITEETVTCSVDVYGQIIADTIFNITKSQFDLLKDKMNTLEPAGKKVNEKATGTKTHRLTISGENMNSYQLIWDSLNTVNDETKDFITSIKSFVPNLKELKSSPLPSE